MAFKDELSQLIDEARTGMKIGEIYDTRNMQLIWMQYNKNCNSILISQDNGLTWTDPPYVDPGKWYYDGWLFRLK